MRPTPKILVALSSLMLISSAALPLAARAPAPRGGGMPDIFRLAEGIEAPATVKAMASPRAASSAAPATAISEDQTGF